LDSEIIFFESEFSSRNEKYFLVFFVEAEKGKFYGGGRVLPVFG